LYFNGGIAQQFSIIGKGNNAIGGKDIRLFETQYQNK
jgi:hypothetical protein